MISQGANQVSRLPLQQLAYILELVDVKERLTSCALVHSSWRTAAAVATTKINVLQYRNNSISLSAWLQSHCSKVRLSGISIHRVMAPLKKDKVIDPLQLPAAKLQHLQQLSLAYVPWKLAAESAGQQPMQSSSEQQAAVHSLAQLTALTRLDLSGASVKLDGLEALTGLKELSIGHDRLGIHTREMLTSILGYFKADTATADLAAALPLLQRLTHLELPSSLCRTAVLAQISTLQHLEQLTINPSAPTNLPPLPQSLTHLCSTHTDISNGAAFSKLTGLQELTLKNSTLDTEVLKGMGRVPGCERSLSRTSPWQQPRHSHCWCSAG